MATLQTVNLGSVPNDPSADTFRVAFQKVMNNETVIFNALSDISGSPAIIVAAKDTAVAASIDAQDAQTAVEAARDDIVAQVGVGANQLVRLDANGDLVGPIIGRMMLASDTVVPLLGEQCVLVDSLTQPAVGEYRIGDGVTMRGVPIARWGLDTTLEDSYTVASKLGEALIQAAFRNIGHDNSRVSFATTKIGSSNFTIKTTTGYARLLYPDGTFGPSGGTGAPGSFITLTIPAGTGVRAYGVMSLFHEGGTVPQGSITELNMSGCGLATYSGDSQSFLTNLNLSSNQLTSFVPVGLTALTELRLAHNKLSAFSCTGLSALTQLYLADNRIASFSGTGLAVLTYLDIAQNLLTLLTSTGLSTLTTLYITSNELTAFSGAGFTALQVLQAEDNQIATFSGTGLNAALDINLSYNNLATFSGTGLNAAWDINLSYNNLATFSGAGMPTIPGLNLSNNPLTSVRVIGYTFAGNSSTSSSSDPNESELMVGNCSLNADALNQIYTDLATGTGRIWVAGNSGVSGDTPSIATGKGYIVIG